MKTRSKRLAKWVALLAATSALAGCYYEPDYVRRGDAYYGTDYYGGDYYYYGGYLGPGYYGPGYYSPWYYGGYWPGYYYGPSSGIHYGGHDHHHHGGDDHGHSGHGHRRGGWSPSHPDTAGMRMPRQTPGTHSSGSRSTVPSAPSHSRGSAAPSHRSMSSPSRGGHARATKSH